MPTPAAARSASRRIWRKIVLVAVVGVSLAVGFSARPTATARAVDPDEWTSSMVADPTTTAPGSTVSLTATVTSATTDIVLVDIEVYDARWHKVHQFWWDRVRLEAGEQQTFRTTMRVPSNQAAGTLRVKIGVFGAGWTGGLHHWNDNAATVVVSTSTPPVTTAVPTTPPPPPTASSTTTSTTTTTTTTTSTTAPSPTGPSTTAPAPLPPPASPGPVAGGQFLATFDTAEDFYGRFVMQVAGRSTIAQWQGDHNHNCEAPTTQRTVHRDVDAEHFWWCAPGGDPTKGHIMTSMYTEGYGQVSFSPNRSFTGIRQVCWDQSMVGLPRKWTQVVIVPESMYQANGGQLHYVNPGVQPVPAINSLSIGALPTDAYGEPDGTNLQRTEEWARGEHGAAPWDSYLLTFTNGMIGQWSRQGEDSYINTVTADSNAPRFRQCFVDNENGTITHTNQLGNGSQRQPITLAGSIPDGPARVIFQDDTYDSFKTDLGDRSAGANPLATWHWDNISIS